MVVRPVAGMPRDHRLFIQGDESMHLEDLGLPASSVFREDGVQKVIMFFIWTRIFAVRDMHILQWVFRLGICIVRKWVIKSRFRNGFGTKNGGNGRKSRELSIGPASGQRDGHSAKQVGLDSRENSQVNSAGPESKPKRSHEEEDPPGAFMGGIQDLVGKQSSKVDAKTREVNRLFWSW